MPVRLGRGADGAGRRWHIICPHCAAGSLDKRTASNDRRISRRAGGEAPLHQSCHKVMMMAAGSIQTKDWLASWRSTSNAIACPRQIGLAALCIPQDGADSHGASPLWREHPPNAGAWPCAGPDRGRCCKRHAYLRQNAITPFRCNRDCIAALHWPRWTRHAAGRGHFAGGESPADSMCWSWRPGSMARCRRARERHAPWTVARVATAAAALPDETAAPDAPDAPSYARQLSSIAGLTLRDPQIPTMSRRVSQMSAPRWGEWISARLW